MRQSIYTVNTTPPPWAFEPAYPWAFELSEILWSNFPLPGQKCCSNAPHITENYGQMPQPPDHSDWKFYQFKFGIVWKHTLNSEGITSTFCYKWDTVFKNLHLMLYTLRAKSSRISSRHGTEKREREKLNVRRVLDSGKNSVYFDDQL
jgi:hypothetical protein